MGGGVTGPRKLANLMVLDGGPMTAEDVWVLRELGFAGGGASVCRRQPVLRRSSQLTPARVFQARFYGAVRGESGRFPLELAVLSFMDKTFLTQMRPHWKSQLMKFRGA